jgi:hypothetical protein
VFRGRTPCRLTPLVGRSQRMTAGSFWRIRIDWMSAGRGCRMISSSRSVPPRFSDQREYHQRKYSADLRQVQVRSCFVARRTILCKLTVHRKQKGIPRTSARASMCTPAYTTRGSTSTISHRHEQAGPAGPAEESGPEIRAVRGRVACLRRGRRGQVRMSFP